MGAPPVSEDGNDGSVPEFAPPWAYALSCAVMSSIGGRPRSMRSSFTAAKTCSARGRVSSCDSNTGMFPTPSRARAWSIDVSQSALLGAMFAGRRQAAGSRRRRRAQPSARPRWSRPS